jgi:hydrogenase maturation protease
MAQPGTASTARRIRVLACGESARGDDAAGFLAADLLQAWLGGVEPPPPAIAGAVETLGRRVGVDKVGQLEPDELLALDPDDALVVIDAVSGPEPGTLVRRALADLTSGGPAPRSSHMLPLRDVLGLVQTLRGSLPRGTFVGLGGSSFGLGDPVSGPVRDAIPALAVATLEEAVRLAGD